ncbi:unnamed protein product [Lampetra planeri]
MMEDIGGHRDASGVLKSRPAPLHKILTGVPQVPAEVGLPEVNLIFIEHRVRPGLCEVLRAFEVPNPLLTIIKDLHDGERARWRLPLQSVHSETHDAETRLSGGASHSPRSPSFTEDPSRRLAAADGRRMRTSPRQVVIDHIPTATRYNLSPDNDLPEKEESSLFCWGLFCGKGSRRSAADKALLKAQRKLAKTQMRARQVLEELWRDAAAVDAAKERKEEEKESMEGDVKKALGRWRRTMDLSGKGRRPGTTARREIDRDALIELVDEAMSFHPVHTADALLLEGSSNSVHTSHASISIDMYVGCGSSFCKSNSSSGSSSGASSGGSSGYLPQSESEMLTDSTPIDTDDDGLLKDDICAPPPLEMELVNPDTTVVDASGMLYLDRGTSSKPRLADWKFGHESVSQPREGDASPLYENQQPPGFVQQKDGHRHGHGTSFGLTPAPYPSCCADSACVCQPTVVSRHERPPHPDPAACEMGD